MKSLIILNDPPYGTERSYNGLRRAHALQKKDAQAEVTVFLMADAVLCAKAGQKTPEGFYDARGLAEAEIASGRAAQHDGRAGRRNDHRRQSACLLNDARGPSDTDADRPRGWTLT